VVFGDGTYLEALGVLQPTDHNLAVRNVLAEREGPYGLAFKTADADAAAAEFAAAGIGPGAALAFARPVALPSGAREAAFRVARTEPVYTPGAWLFVCQHRTPEVTWRHDHLEQMNGARGIAEVVGIAEDLDGVQEAYRRIFGDRLARHEDAIVIDAGSARIAFLAPAAFAARFAPFGQGIAAIAPRLGAVRLRTASLAQTEEVLCAGGIGATRTAEGTLLVAPADACGTILEFAGS
jgi:hypothetical protein